MKAKVIQDKSVCPLCSAQNQCVLTGAGDVDISLCWCSRVSIDLNKLKTKLEDVEIDFNQSCICPQCAQQLQS